VKIIYYIVGYPSVGYWRVEKMRFFDRESELEILNRLLEASRKKNIKYLKIAEKSTTGFCSEYSYIPLGL